MTEFQLVDSDGLTLINLQGQALNGNGVVYAHAELPELAVPEIRVRAIVRNEAGLETTTQLSLPVLVDDDAPRTFFTRPSNGSTYDRLPPIAYGIGADGQGSQVNQVSVSFDDMQTWNRAVGNDQWQIDFPTLTTGQKSLYTQSTDNAGNIEFIDQPSLFTYDPNKPSADIHFPYENQHIQGNTFPIQGTANDRDNFQSWILGCGWGAEPNRFEVIADSNELGVETIEKDTLIDWDIRNLGSKDPFTLVLSVVDQNNNVSQFFRRVYIDNPPVTPTIAPFFIPTPTPKPDDPTPTSTPTPTPEPEINHIPIVSLEPEWRSLSLGEETTAKIVVDSKNYPLGAYRFVLQYPSGMLEYQSTADPQKGDEFPIPLVNANQEEGTILFNGYQSRRLDGPMGRIELVEITFQSNSQNAQQGIISIDAQVLTDTNVQEIPRITKSARWLVESDNISEPTDIPTPAPSWPPTTQPTTTPTSEWPAATPIPTAQIPNTNYIAFEYTDGDSIPNNRLSLDLYIHSGPQPLGGFNLTIHYDPLMLLYEESQQGTSYIPFPLTQPSVDPSAGSLRISSYQFQSITDPVGKNHVATLIFSVIGEQGEQVTLDCDIIGVVDTNGFDIDTVFIPFSIKLGEPVSVTDWVLFE